MDMDYPIFAGDYYLVFCVWWWQIVRKDRDSGYANRVERSQVILQALTPRAMASELLARHNRLARTIYDRSPAPI